MSLKSSFASVLRAVRSTRNLSQRGRHPSWINGVPESDWRFARRLRLGNFPVLPTAQESKISLIHSVLQRPVCWDYRQPCLRWMLSVRCPLLEKPTIWEQSGHSWEQRIVRDEWVIGRYQQAPAQGLAHYARAEPPDAQPHLCMDSRCRT